MVRLLASPSKGLCAGTFSSITCSHLSGVSLGGIVVSTQTALDGAFEVVIEEPLTASPLRIVVRFKGLWRAKLKKRLHQNDRVYVSGAGVEVVRAASAGTGAGGGRFAPFSLLLEFSGAKVAMADRGSTSGAREGGVHRSGAPSASLRPLDEGLASIALAEGSAVMWEPVRSTIASSTALRAATLAGKAAPAAGENHIYSAARIISSAGLASLPDVDEDEEDEEEAAEAAGAGAGAGAGFRTTSSVGRAFDFTFDAGLEQEEDEAAASASALAQVAASMADAMAGRPPPAPAPARLAAVSAVPTRPSTPSMDSKLLAEAQRSKASNFFVWGIVLNWKASAWSRGSDRFIIMTIIDDSGPQAEGGVFLSDLKVFHTSAADAPKPVFVGDVICVRITKVDDFGGRVELQCNAYGGGIILQAPVPAEHGEGGNAPPPSSCTFGTKFARHPESLTNAELSRAAHLMAWWSWQCARPGRAPVIDQRGMLRTLAAMRYGSSPYLDTLSLVAATTAEYDFAVEMAQVWDAKMEAAGGASMVKNLALRKEKGVALRPGVDRVVADADLTALVEWLHRPDVVLRGALGGREVKLFLWDGSDASSSDGREGGDRRDVRPPEGWAGRNDTARGSILRLVIEDNISEVVRLRLARGDWLVVRNMKLKLYNGLLDGHAGRAAGEDGKNGSCGVLRLPLRRRTALQDGLEAVPCVDVRNRIGAYIAAQLEDGLVKAEHLPPGTADYLAVADRPIVTSMTRPTKAYQPPSAAPAAAATSIPPVGGVPPRPATAAAGPLPPPIRFVTLVTAPHTVARCTVREMTATIKSLGSELAGGRIGVNDHLGDFVITVSAKAIMPTDPCQMAQPTRLLRGEAGGGAEPTTDKSAVAFQASSSPPPLSRTLADRNAREILLPGGPEWAFHFSLRVEDGLAEGSVPSSVDDFAAMCLITCSGPAAEGLLIGLPACDLRASPVVLNGVANRLGSLLAATAVMQCGVSAFYMPQEGGEEEEGRGAGAGGGKGRKRGREASLDDGQRLLRDTVFVLVNTQYQAEEESGGGAPAHVHTDACTCRVTGRALEELRARPKVRGAPKPRGS
jgi:hypothetical protein